MFPEASLRACVLLLAATLGASGAFFTYASFNDPASAGAAVLTLVPSAVLLWALPDKRPKQRRPPPTNSSATRAVMGMAVLLSLAVVLLALVAVVEF
jgi:hypothetical protein